MFNHKSTSFPDLEAFLLKYVWFKIFQRIFGMKFSDHKSHLEAYLLRYGWFKIFPTDLNFCMKYDMKYKNNVIFPLKRIFTEIQFFFFKKISVFGLSDLKSTPFFNLKEYLLRYGWFTIFRK